MLMRELHLDQLAVAGGEGAEILRRVKRPVARGIFPSNASGCSARVSPGVKQYMAPSHR
jgi:hypothetical protein